jgi:hypothetical protein
LIVFSYFDQMRNVHSIVGVAFHILKIFIQLSITLQWPVERSETLRVCLIGAKSSEPSSPRARTRV